MDNRSRSGLLDSEALERSEVVANCRMNRERGLASYRKELGLDPVAFLTARAAERGAAAWLDVCCGSGKALIEAAQALKSDEPAIRIVGVDLVDHFMGASTGPKLALVQGALPGWEPDGRFDLITCVHGLHYVGDKLRLLERAAGWLAPAGLFVAHLDPANLRIGEDAAPRTVLGTLRHGGFDYDRYRGLVSLREGSFRGFGCWYLGADDRFGPNRTGQPAVTSHYALRQESPPGSP